MKQESPIVSLFFFTDSVCFLGQVEDRNKKIKNTITFPNDASLFQTLIAS